MVVGPRASIAAAKSGAKTWSTTGQRISRVLWHSEATTLEGNQYPEINILENNFLFTFFYTFTIEFDISFTSHNPITAYVNFITCVFLVGSLPARD